VLILATGLASAQSSPDPRIPALYSTASNPLLQPWNARAEFEGPNTADFFNSINNPASPNASLMANPQIAVGPDEMLLIANSQIWRLPNGNAPGVIPTGLYPGSVLTAGQAFGAQRASLDNWLGATALARLCPTGNTDPSGVLDTANTRSAVTCQIDNATVSYDQMHGRFLVLFTVVDTGMTFNQATQSFSVTRPRKASWVLIVSRFAVLVDQACFQGTEPIGAGACPQPPIPGSGANAAGSFAFVTPTPPTGSNTGGVNATIWYTYYGSDLATLGGDGFGSTEANAGVGHGNINSFPGIIVGDPLAQSDCSAAGISATTAPPTTFCYVPTGARLGVDNDTVTIVSPVINANVNGASFNATYNPAGGLMPGYAGNRVRVIKKTRLYTGSGLRVVAGDNQFTGTNAASTDYYDLFTNAAGAPVANVPPVPFTAILNDVACTPNTVPANASVAEPANLCRMTPVFYEPAHLRGRAQASFSNLAIATLGGGQNSATYLVGAISTGVTPQSHLYVQGIQEVYPNPAIIPANTFGPSAFYPVLMTGVLQTPANQLGTPSPVNINSGFLNPTVVPQLNYRGSGDTPGAGAAAPNMFVGDSRPHNVIFREGHLYDARVVATSPQQTFFSPSTLSTTTKYEIIQKNCSVGTALNCPSTLTTILASTTVAGSTTVVVNTANLSPGMSMVGPNVPANTVVVSLGVNAANATTIVINQPAIVSGTTNHTYSNVVKGDPLLVYQTNWQNTNAYAPMFDVPANVVTFGVGTPYNALNFLEKLFVATTVPPLGGLPDNAFATAPAGTPTAIAQGFDFVAAAPEPRTRQLFGSQGLAPISMPSSGNCFSYLLSPGASISGGANNPLAYASLFDTRCGTDVTDSNPQLRDPYSGQTASLTAYTIRGGEAIDPNDGSLWNFGAYAQRRDASVTALAHWGTFAANYKMSFPTTDVYGNATTLFTDIVGAPEQPFIQIAINNGLTPSIANAAGIPVAPPNSQPIPFAGVNATLYGTAAGANPIPAGARGPGQAPPAGIFGLDDPITRREMAYWIVKSTMDETAITVFLNNSTALNGVSGAGPSAVSFADVPASDNGWRYVEVMARKGWTSGCAAGVARRYCPDYISTRRDLAAFMIRAKFGNVFASVLSGCAIGFTSGTTPTNSSIFPPALTTSCGGNAGDNFGLFASGLPYFTDNPAQTGNDWYPFIQKMRELRITNGTSLGPNLDGRNGLYNIGSNGLPLYNDPGALTRRQVVVFMVRGFFL
jgi:hypothetical protein